MAVRSISHPASELQVLACIGRLDERAISKSPNSSGNSRSGRLNFLYREEIPKPGSMCRPLIIQIAGRLHCLVLATSSALPFAISASPDLDSSGSRVMDRACSSDANGSALARLTATKTREFERPLTRPDRPLPAGNHQTLPNHSQTCLPFCTALKRHSVSADGHIDRACA